MTEGPGRERKREGAAVLVAPSLLSADFARLGEEARAMEAAGADWLHLDVMDFHFVPNLTVGPMVAASLRKETDLPIDAHLMVTDPVALARPFAEAGVDWITFHVEAVADPARAAREIRGMGVKVGVSLKPGTPLEALEPCLGEVDLVLVMGVEPGFGGQAWIPETLEKARGENGLLVMFICNHCPYVKAIRDRIVRDTRQLRDEYGVNSIAIMSNDPSLYEEDSFENMKKVAEMFDFPFPYVMDESQEVAKAYGAVCTPDFFGYNKDLKLQYRGRLDASKKQAADPDVRRDLFEAMVQVAKTGKGPEEQIPSMGCSIKWKDE